MCWNWELLEYNLRTPLIWKGLNGWCLWCSSSANAFALPRFPENMPFKRMGAGLQCLLADLPCNKDKAGLILRLKPFISSLRILIPKIKSSSNKSVPSQVYFGALRWSQSVLPAWQCRWHRQWDPVRYCNSPERERTRKAAGWISRSSRRGHSVEVLKVLEDVKSLWKLKAAQSVD